MQGLAVVKSAPRKRLQGGEQLELQCATAAIQAEYEHHEMCNVVEGVWRSRRKEKAKESSLREVLCEVNPSFTLPSREAGIRAIRGRHSVDLRAR